MQKDFSVTITREALDRAIHEGGDLDSSLVFTCVIAQAVKPIHPECWVAADAMIKVNIPSKNMIVDPWDMWAGDANAQIIQNKYDTQQYESLREMLPMTVNFKYLGKFS